MWLSRGEKRDGLRNFVVVISVYFLVSAEHANRNEVKEKDEWMDL